MNRSIVLFLFSLCLAVGHATECRVGETKQVECNSCICTENGEFACTMKLCLATNAKVRREIGVPGAAGKQCEQGAEWKQDCNKCFCTESGVPACTMKACPAKYPETREKRSPRYIITDCQPGTRWTKGCRECYCTKYGVPACEVKTPCDPEDMTESPETDDQQTEKPEIPRGPHYIITDCQPGTRWTKKCRECYCTKYGVPACVKAPCDPEDMTESPVTDDPQTENPKIPHGPHYITTLCQPGASWTKGTQQCYCTMRGVPACEEKKPEDVAESRDRKACSGKPCEAAERHRRNAENMWDSHCKPGVEWIQGDLQCFCSNEGHPICMPKDGPHGWGY